MVTTKQIEFNKEYYLTTYMENGFSFNISIEITNEVKFNFLKDPVQIALNNKGKLTEGCEANIEGLIVGIETENLDGMDLINSQIEALKNVAVSITSGNIGYSFNFSGVNPVFSIIVTTDDIFPESDAIDQEMGIKINFEVIPTGDGDKKYEFAEENVNAIAVAGLTIVILALVLQPETGAIAAYFEFFDMFRLVGSGV